jgi:hypothetical protein
MDFKVPQDAKSLTFSLKLKPEEQIKLDGFIIMTAD